MYGQNMYYPAPVMQNAQQRLQAMEAQYPQYGTTQNMGYTQPNMYQQPQQQQTASAAPILKGRPVSNEEEANAAMIDFDGSLFVFPDNAHGKIYTKQLGLDGNIVFRKYAMEQGSTPSPAPQSEIDLSGYVTTETLEKRLSEIKEAMNGLEQKIRSVNKGGNKA